jgi:ATP-dependent DNA ligase
MYNTTKPMKISHVPDEVIETLLDDDAWVLEQKMDGARALVHWTPETGFAWLSSMGTPLKFAAAVQHLPAIEAELTTLLVGGNVTEILLDGEIVVGTGVYHLFDMPFTTGWVSLESPYDWRRTMLDTLFEHAEAQAGYAPFDRVVRVPTADGSAKRGLWALIKVSGVEGGVFKRLDGTYQPGVRTTQQVKAKLVKSADVVVMGWVRNRTEEGREIGNIAFGVHDENGVLKALGSCSIIGKPEVADGDVIEVEYLYKDAKGGLIQPRMTRVRLPEEKVPADCTMEQFPVYSRKALAI